jgi:transposase
MRDAQDPTLPGVSVPAEEPAAPAGEARYETANRTQIELTPTDLEGLLPPGHAARLVWRFVEGLDLSAFYATIKAREGHAGRPPIDPKILIALWLYATIDGVGSAREVARLCHAHDAYRWLRGGVSINHHTLSDFRVGQQTALDALLTQSIAVLLDRQVVTLHRLAQDGTKVRANAGVRSFRRGERLRECLTMARQQVERAQRQDDGGGTARERAAAQRAADERVSRVDAALAQLPAIEAVKRRNRSPGTPKASTTDPDARVMKLSDGGYRPAYNVQFATDVEGQVIVGVDVTNVGSDQHALLPMLDQVQRRTGRTPTEVLVDGGYVNTASLVTAAARAVTVYAPVPKGSHAPGSGPDPDPAIVAWRTRMATDDAKALYKTRAATAERINADTRTHRGLTHIPVRGLLKIQTWVLWIALAHNVLRAMAIVPSLMT